MKIKIEVYGIMREVDGEEGKTALDILQENEILVSAVCGGRGTCGKCRIRCTRAKEVTIEEKTVLTAQEIASGIRLACKVVPLPECQIQILDEETEFEIMTKYDDKGKPEGIKKEKSEKKGENGTEYFIAIDIGTTTLAGILTEKMTDLVLASESRMNGQRPYGADVISRMQASNTGKKEKLQACIQADLREIIELLIKTSKVRKEEVEKIVLAGNTTMIHLLMGYSCEKLGVAPFVPVNLDRMESECETLLRMEGWETPVFILPGISAFVGGDITAGLLATDFMQTDKTNLLIDLGTNGEMAVGNRNRLLVTSAAAGPAFEGGNITFGTGSMKGAVCHAKMTDGEMRLTTIGNEFPITGICGTGSLELLSELLEAGIIDETGLMDQPYFQDGYPLGKNKMGEVIRFMQKDVRELQLAKAAIRAGIETLMERADVSMDELDTIYLAGGFGYRIDVSKAIKIGLLPQGFEKKVKTVGNSSLHGAVQYVKNKESRIQAEDMIAMAEEIQLTNIETFNERYLDCMYFEKIE